MGGTPTGSSQILEKCMGLGAPKRLHLRAPKFELPRDSLWELDAS